MPRGLSPFSVEPEHSRPQTSTSAPRSQSPPSAERDFVFSHSEIFEYVWFQKLITLMFILTGVTMINFLWVFPTTPVAQVDGYEPENSADKIVLAGIVLTYVLVFCSCWLIILIFTSICLAIHFKKMRLPIALARWRDRYQQQHPKLYSYNKSIFWFVLLVFLSGPMYLCPHLYFVIVDRQVYRLSRDLVMGFLVFCVYSSYIKSDAMGEYVGGSYTYD